MNVEIPPQPTQTKEQVLQDIADVFTFNPPQSTEHLNSCLRIQGACKALTEMIVAEVPEGKERTIAMNNILSAALFARHGITQRQVLLVSVPVPEVLMESPPASPSANT